jgi:hypothetical protein
MQVSQNGGETEGAPGEGEDGRRGGADEGAVEGM